MSRSLRAIRSRRRLPRLIASRKSIYIQRPQAMGGKIVLDRLGPQNGACLRIANKSLKLLHKC